MQAFADAYTVLENELSHLSPSDDDSFEKDPGKLLPKIIPSINHVLKIWAVFTVNSLLYYLYQILIMCFWLLS